VGGALDDNNKEVYEKFISLSTPTNGKPLIGVISAASETPEDSGSYYVNLLKTTYKVANVEFIPLDVSHKADADSDVLAEKVKKYTGLLFTGGDQTRVVETFMRDERDTRRDTKVLTAIKERFNAGLVAISGTSAGTDCQQSAPMITGGESYDALFYGPYTEVDEDYPDDLSYDPKGGLGLAFTAGYLDTHFGSRGRPGRMMELALYLKSRGSTERYGFGIDENTALAIEDSTMTVIGENGVSIFDFSQANLDDYDIHQVKYSYLTHGDSIKIDSMGELQFAPAALKSAVVPQENFLRAENEVYTEDVFSSYKNEDRDGKRKNPYEFMKMAGSFTKTHQSKYEGLSYESHPTFTVAMKKTSETLAFHRNANDEKITVTNLMLDITYDRDYVRTDDIVSVVA
jgi:cyanophycinase